MIPGGVSGGIPGERPGVSRPTDARSVLPRRTSVHQMPTRGERFVLPRRADARRSPFATLTASLVILGVVLGISGCKPRSTASQTAWTPVKLDAAHLPNAYRLHDKVISGGLPEGEAAFAELAQLGIQTIISVDGAKPDVELARRHGLRYVHLPHGYDGIPAERVEQLAKAVRDLPGPIYVHCHHGKHRSPAAAAAACVSVGFLPSRDALAVLKAAGTSDHYRGLYRAAESARRLDDRLLDGLAANFPATTPVPPLAQAMVDIEHRHDQLKTLARAGWNTSTNNPAIGPAHEALLLREHFTELLRDAQVSQRSESFQRLVQESEQAAQELEATLRATPWTEETTRNAASSLERVSQRCTTCHQQHRDVPRDER